MKRILLLLLLAAVILTTCRETAFDEVAVLPSTNQPTNQPAIQPTNTPTNQPTPQPSNTPTSQPTNTPTNTPTPLPPTPTPTSTPTPTPIPTPHFQQLTAGNCCTDHYWGSDTEIYFIDRNPDSGQTGIWAIDVSGDDFTPRFVTDRLGRYSPNGRYLAYPDNSTGLAVIEELETGQSWTLDLNESPVNFAPDGEHILWIEADQDKPFEERLPVYWISRVDGSDERQIAALPRSSTLDWLDNDTLLISIFDSDEGGSRFATRWATVAKFSLLDGSVTPLFRFERPRSVVLNPSKTALVYFTALADDPTQNGIWYVDLAGPDFDLKKLPFVGSYRWLDDTTLIYIPFDTDATSHYFYTYDVATDQIDQLTGPNMPQLTIANNDWSLSPDRTKIVLLAADGITLDGLWLIDLAPGG